MTRIATAWGLSILIGLAGAAPAPAARATAAHKKLPPRAAAEQAPSLAVTLAYIRDKVAQQGLIAYAGASHDSADSTSWVNQFTVEASEVTVDEANCRVDFHWRTTADGKVVADEKDAGLPLKRITSVTVSDMEEDMARISSRAGHTTWVTTVRPQITVLQALRNSGTSSALDFRDRDTAERVAKAIRHGADLCGGTKSEPF